MLKGRSFTARFDKPNPAIIKQGYALYQGARTLAQEPDFTISNLRELLERDFSQTKNPRNP
jgi:hypothetical protein